MTLADAAAFVATVNGLVAGTVTLQQLWDRHRRR
jgi:hypothetical protein